MKKYLFSVFLMLVLMACGELPAQTLIEDWAAQAIEANPNGIAIDGPDNLYTVNFENNTLTKITPDKMVVCKTVWLILGGKQVWKII